MMVARRGSAPSRGWLTQARTIAAPARCTPTRPPPRTTASACWPLTVSANRHARPRATTRREQSRASEEERQRDAAECSDRRIAPVEPTGADGRDRLLRGRLTAVGVSGSGLDRRLQHDTVVTVAERGLHRASGGITRDN